MTKKTSLRDKKIFELAKWLYETYEDKARLYGWVTQEETRVFLELPEANAKTMLAVAGEIESLVKEKQVEQVEDFMEEVASLRFDDVSGVDWRDPIDAIYKLLKEKLEFLKKDLKE